MRNKTNFWDNVAKTEKCWLWVGRINKDGYGVTIRSRLAHRVSFTTLVGKIPTGFVLHHKREVCNSRNCVNPDHLQPFRPDKHPDSIGNLNRAKTHCAKGHEFSGDNLMLVLRTDGTIKRMCRICHRDRSLESYHKKYNT